LARSRVSCLVGAYVLQGCQALEDVVFDVRVCEFAVAEVAQAPDGLLDGLEEDFLVCLELLDLDLQCAGRAFEFWDDAVETVLRRLGPGLRAKEL
jgi:hypothetical protein